MMVEDSSTFAESDLERYLEEQAALDRNHLANRLRLVSERLAELDLTRAPTSRSPSSQAWTAHEVLAHIVVLSKYYGVLAHRVASGAETAADLLAATRARDSASLQFAGHDLETLRSLALADHARTQEFLATVGGLELRRRAAMPVVGSMSAEEILRLSLVTHLEQHLDQLTDVIRQAASRAE
jgi:hypothetical protein